VGYLGINRYVGLLAVSPFAVKWVFIFMMWLWRFEIVPVIILIMGVFRGFEATVIN